MCGGETVVTKKFHAKFSQKYVLFKKFTSRREMENYENFWWEIKSSEKVLNEV